MKPASKRKNLIRATLTSLSFAVMIGNGISLHAEGFDETTAMLSELPPRCEKTLKAGAICYHDHCSVSHIVHFPDRANECEQYVIACDACPEGNG